LGSFRKARAIEQLTGVYFAQLRENMREPAAKYCDVILCAVAASGNRPGLYNRQRRIPLSSGRHFSSGSPRITHQVTNSQIAAPHSVANQAIEIQTSTSSRLMRSPPPVFDLPTAAENRIALAALF
jgi:hypothetical protein